MDNGSASFNITIAEGATEATLVSEVVADETTYDLSWEGENVYTMQGLFSFSCLFSFSSELEGSLITEDNLIDMQLTFFESSFVKRMLREKDSH